MSFILEALKKSGQQRQKNAASPKQVGARRLSLTPHHSPHRPYWLLVTVLLLFILGGWWHFNASETNQGTPLAVERVENPPPANNQFDSPLPGVIAKTDNTPNIVESETIVEQVVVQAVEPALQPRPVV